MTRKRGIFVGFGVVTTLAAMLIAPATLGTAAAETGGMIRVLQETPLSPAAALAVIEQPGARYVLEPCGARAELWPLLEPRGYSRHEPPLPLFTTDDAEKAISLLTPISVGVAHPVHGADVTLRRAGHILGSATVEITAAGHSLGFSGDLGRGDHPLLVAPDPAPRVSK